MIGQRMAVCRWGLAILMAMAPVCGRALHQPAPVEGYAIAEDGGMVYDPMRREAVKTGQLDAYKAVKTTQRKLDLGAYHLEVQVPESATAYDVVPVPYTLTWDEGAAFPVGVEAVAFEDAGRGNGQDFHDLALPGKIDLGVDYLGSITAHTIPELKHNLTNDFSDTPMEYPNFQRRPMVRSGVVESGDLVWFKFRLTNTGNTILDSDGFGGCQLYPKLLRKNDEGEYVHFAAPYNLYYRNVNYWYPGETWEPWFIFRISKEGQPAEHYALEPGEYKISVQMTYRSYKDADPFLNNWDGPVVFTWEMPITVEAEARQEPVAEGVKLPSAGDFDDKLTRFIHTFEEFMTAFDCHLAQPSGDQRSIQGTLNLQVAPWTENVVVKLIGTGPVAIKSAAIPIDVDADSLAVEVNPAMAHCVIGKDGKRWPVVMSQMMADMRTNVQLGPFPEHHIRNRMREMMDCGINVLATTSMPWMYADIDKPDFNYPGDAWKYALDVARAEGMRIEAWGQYPFDRSTIGRMATWITGKEYGDMALVASGYGGPGKEVSHQEPRLPEANAEVVLYHYKRWGDLFFQEENGTVPVSVGEDTRGWMRNDVNVRYPVGEAGTAVFRKWVLKKYGSLAAINKAWGSDFESVEAIDPETYVEARWGHRWTYLDKSHPFHDWNQAVEDFDIWRTEVRVKNYRDTLEVVRRQIPTAKVVLRTEGGNALVAGLDPESPNDHYRHAYFSQRRVGAIAEVLAPSETVVFHSDYTSIPYTPTELRKIVRMGVEQGIVPAYLPYANDMRDIAINDRYGENYQIHYNLPEPRMGYMTHVLVATYPWLKVMIEEGGVPGIEWEDYQCVAFVTETQKRELRFFQRKLHEALDTPEGEKLRSENVRKPSQDWRKDTLAIRSYRGPEEYGDCRNESK